jgi:AcrR family transcriptional regulator
MLPTDTAILKGEGCLPPRGEHSREELQDLVLTAARGLAMAHGLKGLKARNIAREIGYAPGTIYNVFKDLDDVVVRLNGRTLDQLHAVLTPLPPRPEPEAALMDLARAYIGFIRSCPRLWGLLFEHRLPEGQAVPDWYAEKVQRLLGLISAALAPLFGADEREQQEHSGRVLWSAVEGISSLAGAGKLVEADSVDGLLHALITYYLRGLRASESHPEFGGAAPAEATPSRP